MSKTFKWILLLILLTSVFVLTACGQSSKTETKTGSQDQAKKTYKIAFFVKNTVSPHWKLARLGADTAAKDLGGVEVIHGAPTKPSNIEESINIMEDWITKYKMGQLDAAVFVPVDYKANAPVVVKANQAGLPIISYCNELAAGGDSESYVGVDHVQIAYDTAKVIAEKMNGKGNVIILEGVPGSITSQERKQGFQKLFAEYPGIKILSIQPGNYDRAQGMSVMENLIQQFPQIDAVVSAGDEMALGAAQALESAGKLKGVFISGVDGSDDALSALKKGVMTATADYRGYEPGYVALKTAVQVLKGEKVEKRIMLGYQVVTKENMGEYVKYLEKTGQPFPAEIK